MYEKLSILPIDVEIYAPFGCGQKELSIDFLSKSVAHHAYDVGSNALRINPKWYLILQTVRALNKREYALMVGRTIYQKICFVLTRNGVETGFNFTKGSYGPYSPQVKDSITAFANANLIVERQMGKMIEISVADGADLNKYRYSDSEINAVRKTVDLFGRIKSTQQAEMIATVLFAYDQLNIGNKEITDRDVYDYVLDWKPQWKEEKEFELCDTIVNMAMLSLINIIHTGSLMDTMLL